MNAPNASQEQEGTVPLKLHFTSAQIEWLSERAEEKDISVACVVRQLVEENLSGNTAKSENNHASAVSSSRSADDVTTLDRLRETKEKLGSLPTSDKDETNGELDSTVEDEVPSSPLPQAESQPAENKSGDSDLPNPNASSETSSSEPPLEEYTDDEEALTEVRAKDNSNGPPSMFDLVEQSAGT